MAQIDDTRAPYKDDQNAKAIAENVIDGVYAKPGNEGTALELARAVEGSDVEFHSIHQDNDGQIDIYCQYAGKGGPAAVPKDLHNLLESWGYEHGEYAGEPEDELEFHPYQKR